MRVYLRGFSRKPIEQGAPRHATQGHNALPMYIPTFHKIKL